MNELPRVHRFWNKLFEQTPKVGQYNEDTASTRDRNADLVQVAIGPVTRACAKKFKESVNGLIQATWAHANSWRLIERNEQDIQATECVIRVLEALE